MNKTMIKMSNSILKNKKINNILANKVLTNNIVNEGNSKQKLEIYIHIPFCVKKCNYCDFISEVAVSEVKVKYMEYLLKEIDIVFIDIADKYEISSVFIGGGTPSILAGEDIKKIISKLQKIFLFSYNAEISIECNPETVSYEKLLMYKEAGINRISFGLQSANNEELKLLGRIHNYEKFVENYNLVRSVGFENINIDLMSALPFQTIESFIKTLEKVIKLNPEHISVYSLIIEEGTPFYSIYKDSENIPSEDEDREMYHITKEIMEKNGYNRYEISNYAKEGFECRHNIGYWTGINYRGLGLSASSYIEGMRFSNPRNMLDYIKYIDNLYMDKKDISVNGKLKNNAKSTIYTGLETEKLSISALYEEFMFLGLRLIKGISEKEFEDRFNIKIDSIYYKEIKENVENGLLIRENGYIRLSEKGIDLSNQVMMRFLL